jgi:lysine/ornithine N-monooxygenase
MNRPIRLVLYRGYMQSDRLYLYEISNVKNERYFQELFLKYAAIKKSCLTRIYDRVYLYQ